MCHRTNGERIVIILLAVLSMGLAVESAQCEPSPTMRWLMGENVTLMDFGLYRLQEGLQSNKTIEGSGFIIAVGYDWDTNRINIGSHK